MGVRLGAAVDRRERRVDRVPARRALIACVVIGGQLVVGEIVVIVVVVAGELGLIVVVVGGVVG